VSSTLLVAAVSQLGIAGKLSSFIFLEGMSNVAVAALGAPRYVIGFVGAG
jgi:hypothetical protein